MHILMDAMALYYRIINDYYTYLMCIRQLRDEKYLKIIYHNYLSYIKIYRKTMQNNKNI
jgi:hypothetical protein